MRFWKLSVHCITCRGRMEAEASGSKKRKLTDSEQHDELTEIEKRCKNLDPHLLADLLETVKELKDDKEEDQEKDRIERLVAEKGWAWSRQYFQIVTDGDELIPVTAVPVKKRFIRYGVGDCTSEAQLQEDTDEPTEQNAAVKLLGIDPDVFTELDAGPPVEWKMGDADEPQVGYNFADAYVYWRKITPLTPGVIYTMITPKGKVIRGHVGRVSQVHYTSIEEDGKEVEVGQRKTETSEWLFYANTNHMIPGGQIKRENCVLASI